VRESLTFDAARIHVGKALRSSCLDGCDVDVGNLVVAVDHGCSKTPRASSPRPRCPSHRQCCNGRRRPASYGRRVSSPLLIIGYTQIGRKNVVNGVPEFVETPPRMRPATIDAPFTCRDLLRRGRDRERLLKIHHAITFPVWNDVDRAAFSPPSAVHRGLINQLTTSPLGSFSGGSACQLPRAFS
jgi:hypothetical protein